MKKGIHPKWNKEAKVTFNGKVVMNVGSTLDELNIEIWSGNHPFFTGKEILVDADNLVEKFNKKVKKASAKAINKKEHKRAKRRQLRKNLAAKKENSLKDMLQDFK